MLDADLLKPIADEIDAQGRSDADRLCRRRHAQHLRQQAGAQSRGNQGPQGPRPRRADLEPHLRAAGMAPTVIAYNEVYNAIQNNVIAAGENEAAGVEPMKFYEVAPHLSMTGTRSRSGRCASRSRRSRICPPELQAAVIKAGKEAGAYGRQVESSEDSQKLDRAGEGGQAEARAVRGPRRDEEARRPRHGAVRQGDRRREDLRADQQHQIIDSMQRRGRKTGRGVLA